RPRAPRACRASSRASARRHPTIPPTRPRARVRSPVQSVRSRRASVPVRGSRAPGPYPQGVSFLLERRLRAVGRRLRSLREELQLADEQLAHLADITDDSRIRAMVSETPLADEEHRQAERTSSAMARHRIDLVESIERLEA